MVQPIELDKEPIDLHNLTGRGVQKHFLSSKTFVQPVKGRSISSGRDPTVTYYALNANS